MSSGALTKSSGLISYSPSPKLKAFNWEFVESKTTFNFDILHPVDWPRGSYSQRVRPGDPGYAPQVVYRFEDVSAQAVRKGRPFEELCRTHASQIQRLVEGPWSVSVKVRIADDFLSHRLFSPPNQIGTIGPWGTEQLTDLHEILTFCAETTWVMQQVMLLAHYEVEVGTATSIEQYNELYREWWAEKENLNALSLELRLILEHARLARTALKEGREEDAAQHSKVVFELFTLDKDRSHAYGSNPAMVLLHQSLLADFGRFRPRWRELDVLRENAIGRLSTVVSEGTAEWRSFLGYVYFQHGLIYPMTEEGRKGLDLEHGLASRNNLAGLSPKNPYRQGFEMVDAVVKRFGFWINFTLAVICRWPLEMLSYYVTVSFLEKLAKDSPFSPDERLRLLCDLKIRIPKREPWRETLILSRIHDKIDGRLPGIIQLALDQVNSGEW